jgi:hypothetical protein
LRAPRRAAFFTARFAPRRTVRFLAALRAPFLRADFFAALRAPFRRADFFAAFLALFFAAIGCLSFVTRFFPEATGPSPRFRLRDATAAPLDSAAMQRTARYTVCSVVSLHKSFFVQTTLLTMCLETPTMHNNRRFTQQQEPLRAEQNTATFSSAVTLRSLR